MPPVAFGDLFSQFAVLLLLAAVLGAVAMLLRQPLITAFIALGILVGPSGLRIIRAAEEIELLAQIGLALLLFVVGLRLDLGMIRSMGKVALAAGFGQVMGTAVFGYLICVLLGQSAVSSTFVAITLAFSSTIIVVKLLSDRRETDSLHGRIAVGILIVQDMLVVLAMIGITAFTGHEGNGLALEVTAVIGKGLILLTVLGLLMAFVLPRLIEILCRSIELLVVFAIAWAVVVAGASEALGFSKEVGAFLAGVTLASTAYRDMLGARLVSLRDFLLLFFFIDMGMRLDLRALGTQVYAAIPLSIFVLVGKPLIVMSIMGLMGYRKRTGFLAGLTIAQISEFSLILAALGRKQGLIGDETAGLITFVGLITIGVSTYMILYAQELYDRLSPYLGIFERKARHQEAAINGAHGPREPVDVILFGIGRYGTAIAQHLMARGYTVLGVDFDPQAVREWNQRGWPARFGDAEDPEFPSTLPLAGTRWVASSVPAGDTNTALVSALEEHQYTGSIAVTSHSQSETRRMFELGADLVFMPFSDASTQAVDMLAAADEQQRRRRMEKNIAQVSDHYIVCGYGRMGQQIVKDFQRYNVPHVVVEDNPIQLPKLVEGSVLYVEGKASEDRVLTAAGIQRARGLIAVAASDEENVFIVLTARGLNPNLYIVARSILEENEDKLRRAGADKVMSPYILGGHRMAAAVLKPRAMDFLDLVLHTDHLDLEVGDVTVTAGSICAGNTVSSSGIRERTGVLILAIKRMDGEIEPNPGPDTVLREGDGLIVMGTSAQMDAAERTACGPRP